MSKLLKQMLLLAAGMAAAASESPFASGNRGSHFDVETAKEKDFKVHDKDNDRQLNLLMLKVKL